jgi:acetyl esterase
LCAARNHHAAPPQVKAHLARLSAINFADPHTVSPEQARAGARRLTAASVREPEPVAEVVDRVIGTDAGDVPVRLYRPMGVPPDNSALPVVVFFHGRGNVLGDLDSHDCLARSLANGSESVVVSVDYPLAPGNKSPAPIDAGYTATAWIAGHATTSALTRPASRSRAIARAAILPLSPP